MQDLNIVLVFLIGVFAGGIAIWINSKSKLVELIILREREVNHSQENSKLNNQLQNLQNEHDQLLAQFIETKNDNARLLENVNGLTSQIAIKDAERSNESQKSDAIIASLKYELQILQETNQSLSNQVAELTTSLEAERKQSEEKLELLQNAEKQLSEQFKNIASEILEDKSKRFTEQNQTNLNQLLEPLKTKITEFKNKVEEVYVQEGKERSALGEQVRHLMELNNKLSDDANNLTRALKGEAKTQGNWGEMILERVLEASGLRKGNEYDVQESHTLEDRSRVQPDVVIHLPENRHLIVDAKVSLVAYEEYVNAESDTDRKLALRRHKDSIRNHIKGLSEKNYQQLYGIQSLDFVLMFIPIEPAFMLAISEDADLWHDAWKKNVLLVSPSTLLFVVRTVAHLWRQEQQNKNAQDIATRGAALYDKLVGFVEDLDKVGERISQAKVSYDNAYGKLKSGQGNVIRQAQMLKELGVKPSKSLDRELINSVIEND